MKPIDTNAESSEVVESSGIKPKAMGRWKK
jgi:hypothetical protein